MPTATQRAASDALDQASRQPTQIVGVTLALTALTHTLTAISEGQQDTRSHLASIAHDLGRIATALETRPTAKRRWTARPRRNRIEEP